MSEIQVGDQVAANGLEALARYLWSKWPASCDHDPTDGCYSWEDLNERQQSYWLDRAKTMAVELIPPEMVVMLRSDAAALVEYADAIEANGKILDDDPSPEDFRAAEDRMDKATYAITPEVLARAKEATR